MFALPESAQVRFWTDDRCVEAMQAWQREHGRPPKCNEWVCAGYGHPAANTIKAVFGSWNGGLRAAGLKIRGNCGQQVWTKQRIAEALLDWKFEHGQWPRVIDWSVADPAKKRPESLTVWRRFGSWTAALAYAGRRAECVECSAPLTGRAHQRYCSTKCRNAARYTGNRSAAARRLAPVEPTPQAEAPGAAADLATTTRGKAA